MRLTGPLSCAIKEPGTNRHVRPSATWETESQSMYWNRSAGVTRTPIVTAISGTYSWPSPTKKTSCSRPESTRSDATTPRDNSCAVSVSRVSMVTVPISGTEYVPAIAWMFSASSSA